MKYRQISIFYFLTALLLLGCKSPEKKEIKKESKNFDSYVLVEGWPKLPKDFVLGNPTGLGINSENNIVVFHRASRVWGELMPEDKIQENTILTLNKQTGEVLKSWGANLFIMPHGLEVDNQNNIWVTDCGLHQVFKFDCNGNLLMILGEAKVSGNDSSHFNEPTDIAVAEDGSFYISDGYENSRIAKFSKEGKYLFEWNGASLEIKKESLTFRTE